MPRKAAGKPLALFPIRVDADVKAALLQFKSKGTINQGLRSVLLNESRKQPKKRERK